MKSIFIGLALYVIVAAVIGVVAFPDVRFWNLQFFGLLGCEVASVMFGIFVCTEYDKIRDDRE